MGLFGTRREPLNSELLARLDRIEAQFSILQAEWTEVLDKVSRYFARHRKRERDALRAATADDPARPQAPEGPSPPPAVLARRGRFNGVHS